MWVWLAAGGCWTSLRFARLDGSVAHAGAAYSVLHTLRAAYAGLGWAAAAAAAMTLMGRGD